jgi:hypothetical protein
MLAQEGLVGEQSAWDAFRVIEAIDADEQVGPIVTAKRVAQRANSRIAGELLERGDVNAHRVRIEAHLASVRQHGVSQHLELGQLLDGRLEMGRVRARVEPEHVGTDQTGRRFETMMTRPGLAPIPYVMPLQ